MSPRVGPRHTPTGRKALSIFRYMDTKVEVKAYPHLSIIIARVSREVPGVTYLEASRFVRAWMDVRGWVIS